VDTVLMDDRGCFRSDPQRELQNQHPRPRLRVRGRVAGVAPAPTPGRLLCEGLRGGFHPHPQGFSGLGGHTYSVSKTTTTRGSRHILFGLENFRVGSSGVNTRRSSPLPRKRCTVWISLVTLFKMLKYLEQYQSSKMCSYCTEKEKNISFVSRSFTLSLYLKVILKSVCKRRLLTYFENIVEREREREQER
jgi:hypothetical protein